MELKFRVSVFLIIVAGLSLPTQAYGTNYYVDALNGHDNNTGTSTSLPWASIKRVNQLIKLKPGDQILFHSGQQFQGHLNLQLEGAPTNPILISSYGSGARPEIIGVGQQNPPNSTMSATLHFWASHNFKVERLSITNKFGDIKRHQAAGIFVNNHASAIGDGYFDNIEISNNFIHDVPGGVFNSPVTAGILLSVKPLNSNIRLVGSSPVLKYGAGRAAFRNLKVENNSLSKVGFYGILLDGWWFRNRSADHISGGKQRFPSKNVLIQNNFLADTWGSGITLITTDKSIIQNNELHRTGRIQVDLTPNQINLYRQSETGAPHFAGIWTFGGNDTLIRFNRVMGQRGIFDGEAFDIDNDNLRTILEYNYSQNNGGGFLLMTTEPGYEFGEDRFTYKSTIRYNVSLNDGYQDPINGRTIICTGQNYDSIITNNKFIFTGTGTIKFFDFWDSDKGYFCGDTYFTRNLIYLDPNVNFLYNNFSSSGKTGGMPPLHRLQIQQNYIAMSDWGVDNWLSDYYIDSDLNKRFINLPMSISNHYHLYSQGNIIDARGGDFRLAQDNMIHKFSLPFVEFGIENAGLTNSSSWKHHRDHSMMNLPKSWASPIPKNYFNSQLQGYDP